MQHLLDNKQSIDPIDNIVDIIHTTNKGKINTLEKFYIHKGTSTNNQINKECTVSTEHVMSMY